MLSDLTATPVLAVSDLARARAFYEGTLGFRPSREAAEGVLYAAGGGEFLVYPSAYAGTNQATALSFGVPDDGFDAEVADLRAEAEAKPVVDEAQLTAALGEETARVLSSARQAASDIKERAEENVSRMLREAAETAAATRRDAEAEAARLRDEAQAIRSEADEARRRQREDPGGHDAAGDAPAHRREPLGGADAHDGGDGVVQPNRLLGGFGDGFGGRRGFRSSLSHGRGLGDVPRGNRFGSVVFCRLRFGSVHAQRRKIIRFCHYVFLSAPYGARPVRRMCCTCFIS